MSKSPGQPIGVFDSGIGGLTVLRVLAAQFPDESFIYLGDTARLPYGSKSAQTIRNYTLQNLETLNRLNCKALVIACNSASSQFLDRLYKGQPVYNVIDPGAEAAIEQSQTKVIGILGTRATVFSHIYEKRIKALAPEAEVLGVACPLFVPLAEEGWDEDPITNLIAFRYLQMFKNYPKNETLDTVVLGCTHYPLLRKSIQKILGSSVQLVESGEVLTSWLKRDFTSGFLPKAPTGTGRTIQVLTTDSSDHFQSLAQRILSPLSADEYRTIDLEQPQPSPAQNT